LIELHPIPYEQEAHGRISNWQGSVSGHNADYSTIGAKVLLGSDGVEKGLVIIGEP
jgi:hypothetical protein